MILVDTSVWIDHLHRTDQQLVDALTIGEAGVHPLVVGELAMGTLRNRTHVLALLDDLPQVLEARHTEVRRLIEGHRLHGRGLGLVDAHLLASTLVTPGCRLWSRDRRLASVAHELGVANA